MKTNHPIRHRRHNVAVRLALAFGLFALLMAAAPAADADSAGTRETSALVTDCANSAGAERIFYAAQMDALAGYPWLHSGHNFDLDEIANRDTAHPESLEVQSSIADGVYTETLGPDGTTVTSSFTTTTRAGLRLETGWPAPSGASSAHLIFQEGVNVVGANAEVVFDSELLLTVLEGGSVHSNGEAADLRIIDSTNHVVHQSDIFDHEVVSTIPSTGAVERTITVALDPGEYRIEVSMASIVGAHSGGLGVAVNYLQLGADWQVTCSGPAPQVVAPSGPSARLPELETGVRSPR